MATGSDSSVRHARLFAEAAVAITLLGCVPVTVKYISANPFTIGLVRLAVAVVGTYALVRRESSLRSLPSKHWFVLIGLGLLFGVHWLTYFFSIKISSASTAVIGLSTYGIHLIILGWLFGKARATPVDVFAVIMAIAGNLMVISEFSLADRTTQGLLLAVFSAFFYACLPILHQRYPELSSSVRAFGQFLFALIFFSAFMPLTDWNLALQDWIGLLFLAVACTFVAHTLWVRVITAVSTVTASIVYYLSIPVAMMLSYVWLREPIGWPKLAGAALIITANLMGLRAQWKRKALLARA